jgi:hypothetical protein
MKYGGCLASMGIGGDRSIWLWGMSMTSVETSGDRSIRKCVMSVGSIGTSRGRPISLWGMSFLTQTQFRLFSPPSDLSGKSDNLDGRLSLEVFRFASESKPHLYLSLAPTYCCYRVTMAVEAKNMKPLNISTCFRNVCQCNISLNPFTYRNSLCAYDLIDMNTPIGLPVLFRYN